MSYEAIDGPCAACGRDEVCCDHRGRALCQDCWHGAREQETPYAAFRDADGRQSGGAYLKEEAEARAKKLTDEEAQRLVRLAEYRDDPGATEASREHYAKLLARVAMSDPRWGTFTARPCGSWGGDRMAHPGYMARRRAQVIAAHPGCAG
jgi:hypothetical protein